MLPQSDWKSVVKQVFARLMTVVLSAATFFLAFISDTDDSPTLGPVSRSFLSSALCMLFSGVFGNRHLAYLATFCAVWAVALAPFLPTAVTETAMGSAPILTAPILARQFGCVPPPPDAADGGGGGHPDHRKYSPLLSQSPEDGINAELGSCAAS